MLTRDSVLFYWDAMYGIDPVVGGDPVFTRDAAGWYFDGRMYRKALPGTPRIQRIHEFGEGFGPRPTLALEPAQTQVLFSPHDVSTWSVSGSHSPKRSIIDHPDAEAGSNGGYYGQTSGTLSAGMEVAVAIWESDPTDPSAEAFIYLRDNTSGTWLARSAIAYANGALRWIGTGAAHGSILLSERGPNGGKVWLHWMQDASHIAGNARRIYLYPTGAGAGSGIAHYGGMVGGGIGLFSPIVGDAGAAALQDALYFDAAPPPQAAILYADFIARDTEGGNPMVIQVGGGTGGTARWLLYRGSDQYVVYHHNGTTAVTTSVALAGLTQGDRVELAMLLKDDGGVRVVARRNGGAAVASGFSGALAYAGAWSAPDIQLGARDALGGNAATIDIARAMALRAGDLAAGVGGGGDAILGELADFYLGPNGEVL